MKIQDLGWVISAIASVGLASVMMPAQAATPGEPYQSRAAGAKEEYHLSEAGIAVAEECVAKLGLTEETCVCWVAEMIDAKITLQDLEADLKDGTIGEHVEVLESCAAANQ